MYNARMSALRHVTIYTDGGCMGNPGPGGYAAILISGRHRKEITGGFRLTTNNRMEMMAVIVALKALRRRCKVTVYSDSQYLVNGINLGWAEGWRARGWRKSDKKPAENIDLWTILLGLLEKHEAQLIWLRGHAGNPGNERCDELAVEMSQRKNLPADEVYERMAKAKEGARGGSFI